MGKTFPELPRGEKPTFIYNPSWVGSGDRTAVVLTKKEVRFYHWDGISNLYNSVYIFPRLDTPNP